MTDEHMEANRRHWDEVVDVHVRSEFYDVASFKAGRSKLKPVELAALGDVRGKTLLHLQCHFGMDTICRTTSTDSSTSCSRRTACWGGFRTSSDGRAWRRTS